MKAIGFIVGMVVAGKVCNAIIDITTTEGKARKALAEELVK